MVDCHAVRELVPELLTETLDGVRREQAHVHIEQCELCRAEWAEYRKAWSALDALEEVPLPARVRQRFFAELDQLAPKGNVVEFPKRRIATKWIAQAAAVVALVGGSYFAGQRTVPVQEQPATIAAVQKLPFSIAESRVVPASNISPDIEGRPEIRNVRFENPQPGSSDVAISFDITSHVTVTGKPNEKSLVNLLSYVLASQDHPTLAKSNAMEWVKHTYTAAGTPDPAIVKALASILKNDTHEGVRIKAVETLREIPPANAPEARAALIEALNNDPNPAVRIKAIEALANLARSSTTFDPATLDMLRQKASQDDENTYVRVKAAEALSQISL
jgi:hypothetical protein